MRSFVKFMFVGAVTLGLMSASSAYALRIALPAPQPVQTSIQADVIVIGKVTSIEKDTVEVSQAKGARKEDPKVTYKIAKVKVSDALLGAKGLTEVKVGFAIGGGGAFPAPVPFQAKPAIRPFPAPGGNSVALTEGQEGVFPLVRHFEGDFYILAGGFNAGILEKKAPSYDKDLAQIKKNLEVVKDPVAALKSKDKEERFTAISVLSTKYRQWNGGTPATEEAIPAEEAKLILDVMLELPWVPKAGEANPDYQKTLSSAFGMWLGAEQVRLKFQYPQPKPGDSAEVQNKMYQDAIAKFIKENREKFTLKKFVEKK